MRQSYSTITSSLLRSTDHAALQQVLPWKRHGRLITVSRLLDLLALVAALRSSLSAVVRGFRFGFSHETARQAVTAARLIPSSSMPRSATNEGENDSVDPSRRHPHNPAWRCFANETASQAANNVSPQF
jgi:hypothetical protein